METFLLYCDLSTMKCTVDDINNTLQGFSDCFIQVNNSLWFFRYDIKRDVNPLPKEENIFYKHFEKFTSKESIFFIEILSNKYFYEFPDTVHNWLQQD